MAVSKKAANSIETAEATVGELAEYVAATTATLRDMVLKIEGFELLSYFLDMARIEAATQGHRPTGKRFHSSAVVLNFAQMPVNLRL